MGLKFQSSAGTFWHDVNRTFQACLPVVRALKNEIHSN